MNLEIIMFFVIFSINILYALNMAKIKNKSIKKDAFIFQIVLAVALLLQAIKTIYSL